MDAKLSGAKIFQDTIETPIAINENGYIGINPNSHNARIFNISEVTEYKITTGDPKKNTVGGIGAGAVIGGLAGALLGGILGAGGTGSYASSASRGTALLGGLGAASGALIGGGGASEKISNIYLEFKVNDFHNSVISVPLITRPVKTDSNRFNEIKIEIQKIISTLDFLSNTKEKLLPESNSGQIPIRGNEVVNRNSKNYMQVGDVVECLIGGKFYVLTGHANLYSVFTYKESGQIAYYEGKGESCLIIAAAHVNETTGEILSIVTANKGKGMSGITKELVGGISVIEQTKMDSMREAIKYIENN